MTLARAGRCGHAAVAAGQTSSSSNPLIVGPEPWRPKLGEGRSAAIVGVPLLLLLGPRLAIQDHQAHELTSTAGTTGSPASIIAWIPCLR